MKQNKILKVFFFLVVGLFFVFLSSCEIYFNGSGRIRIWNSSSYDIDAVSIEDEGYPPNFFIASIPAGQTVYFSVDSGYWYDVGVWDEDGVITYSDDFVYVGSGDTVYLRYNGTHLYEY